MMDESEQLSAEYDADVAQDEVLHEGGLYNVGILPGAGGRILLIAGVVLLVAGLLLELMVAGYIYPIPNYFPTSLGSAFVLSVVLLGLVCVGLGAVARSRQRRDPDRLKPIV
jgi:hypothetical protein